MKMNKMSYILIRIWWNLCYLNAKMNILLTKIIAAQNEAALSYHRVRGLYFLAVIVGATIVKEDINLNINLSN